MKAKIKASLAAGALLVVAAGTGVALSASSASASIPDPEYTLRTEPYFIDYGTTVNGYASCLTGEVAVSGGYQASSAAAPYVTAYYNYPDVSGSTDRWNVGFRDNGPSSTGTQLVYVHVLCAVLD